MCVPIVPVAVTILSPASLHSQVGTAMALAVPPTSQRFHTYIEHDADQPWPYSEPQCYLTRNRGCQVVAAPPHPPMKLTFCGEVLLVQAQVRCVTETLPLCDAAVSTVKKYVKRRSSSLLMQHLPAHACSCNCRRRQPTPVSGPAVPAVAWQWLTVKAKCHQLHTGKCVVASSQ